MNDRSNSKLESFTATLQRIETKLQTLQADIESYYRSSHRVIVRDDIDRGERHYYLAEVIEPGPALTIDVTEIVGLMRPLLDHLMYRLVRNAHGGSVRNSIEGKVKFPILRPRKRLAVDSDFELAEDTWILLESIQQEDLSGQPRWPLAVLNDLANVSKHRFHNSLSHDNLRVSSAAMGSSNFCYSDKVGIHIKIGSRRVRSMHPIQASFRENAIVYRFVPEKNTFLNAPRIYGIPASAAQNPGTMLKECKTAIAFLNGVVECHHSYPDLIADANQIEGCKWMPRQWQKYFDEIELQIEITQCLVFGPGSKSAKGLPVFDTLQQISRFLSERVFSDFRVLKLLE